MTASARLTIQFHGFWLAGTGAARGRDVDSVCHRDEDGYPAMPMSQIKGQLRESGERLAALGAANWTSDLVTELFGYRSREERGVTDPKFAAGRLAFRGAARLADDARAALSVEQRPMLFRRLAATKINSMGVAEDKTLRAIEAAVPLELFGRIDWIDAEQPLVDWIALMDAACAATLAFGKLKSDGYGRATAKVEAMP